MSPVLPPQEPRDLARLLTSEGAASPSRLTLQGDGTERVDSLPAALPAAAREEAQRQTQEMELLFQQGQYNKSLQAGRRALPLLHALQDHAMSCATLRMMSAACMEQEQCVEALALGRHALRLARVRAEPAELVQALALLGALHGRLQDVGVGETLVMQALSRARELHDRPVLLQTLDALLLVLLDAHEAQRLAGDSPAMQATAQRLHRHALHALLQRGPRSEDFIDLELRVHAAAALVACGHSADALPVLTECSERAHQAGYRISGLWASLYGAQASMRLGNDRAALAALQLLAPMLSADDPPRLRLASLSLQALLAERAGAAVRADEQRMAAHTLRDSLLRQRFKLRATLRRNAEDVMQTLATLDRDGQPQGGPSGATAGPAAATSTAPRLP